MKHLLITIVAVLLAGFGVQQQSAAQQSLISEPVAGTSNPESGELKNDDSEDVVKNGFLFVLAMSVFFAVLFVILKINKGKTLWDFADGSTSE